MAAQEFSSLINVLSRSQPVSSVFSFKNNFVYIYLFLSALRWVALCSTITLQRSHIFSKGWNKSRDLQPFCVQLSDDSDMS